MSGETEASVSSWTVDTLREHVLQKLADQRDALRQQIDDQRASVRQQTDDLRGSFRQQTDDLRRMLDERYATQTKALDAAFKAAEQAVQTALVSAEKAVTKAESAADKRFDLINEFREALTDQTATFLPRIEYDAAHQALVDRINLAGERIGALELRLTSRLDISEGSVSGGAYSRTERRLDLGQVIAVVAVIVAIVSVMIVVFKK